MPHGLSAPTDTIWPLREQTRTSHKCKSLPGAAAVGRPPLLVCPSGHRPQWAHLLGPMTEAGDTGQGTPAPRSLASGEDRHEQRKGCSGGAKPSFPDSWGHPVPTTWESPCSVSPALSMAPLPAPRAVGRVNRRQMAEAKASSGSSSAVLLTHTPPSPRPSPNALQAALCAPRNTPPAFPHLC